MQHSITIVFPHQLFKRHPAIAKKRKIFLLEETLFFNQYNFHKQKLVLHRASMQFFKVWLIENNFDVEYVEANKITSDIRMLVEQLAKNDCTEIHLAELVDDWLNKD